MERRVKRAKSICDARQSIPDGGKTARSEARVRKSDVSAGKEGRVGRSLFRK